MVNGGERNPIPTLALPLKGREAYFGGQVFIFSVLHGAETTTFAASTHLFAHRFSATSLFIPACLQIELKVPCGILRLFLGTITTLVCPA